MPATLAKILVFFSFFSAMAAPTFAGSPKPAEAYDLISNSQQGPQDRERWLKFVAQKNAQGNWEIFQAVANSEENEITFHAEYVKQRLRPDLSAKEIIDRAHFNQGREFYFGTFFLGREIYDPKKKTSTFSSVSYDLVARDFPAPADVRPLNEALREYLNQVVNAENLHYAPLAKFSEATRAMESAFSREGISLSQLEKIASTEEVYTADFGVGKIKRLTAQQADQALSDGSSFGDTILVIDGAPSDLPLAAGYVLSLPTSPNSHPALLAQMFGAPLIFQKNAYNNPRIIELEEKNAWALLVANDPYATRFNQQPTYLQEVDTATKDQLLAFKQKPQIGALPSNRETRAIVESSAVQGGLDGSAYGAKAKGLVTIKNSVAEKFTIPSLFVPLYFQDRFFATAKYSYQGEQKLLAHFIQEQLKNAETESPVELALRLNQIRAAIEQATVEENFFSPVVDQLLAFAQKTNAQKLFLRSSSNAEDHALFNGAGLYDSKGATLDPQAIQRALRTVWASLYNLKAYVARRQFGIQENTVGMGVVVQGFLQNVRSQGVVVSKLNAEDESTYQKVTSFPGLLQVTSPPPGKIPETVEVEGVPGNEKYLTIKNYCQDCGEDLRLGETILTKAEYLALTGEVDRITKNWPQDLDVEWLKSGDNIYLVQARVVPRTRELPNTILAGSPRISLSRTQIDSDSDDPAILRIRGEIDLHLRLLAQPEFNQNWIDLIEYTYRGQQFRMERNQMQIQESGEGRDKTLTYSLRHPQLKTLALKVTRPNLSGVGERPRTELLTAQDFQFHLQMDSVKQFPKSKRVTLTRYGYEDESTFRHYKLPLTFNPDYDGLDIPITNTVVGKRKSGTAITLRVEYLKDLDPKHYSLLLRRVSVTGLDPTREITFTQPASMVYSALDHHLGPELALDLTLADQTGFAANIPELKGARYLWIFSEGVPARGSEEEGGFGGIAAIGEDGLWLKELTAPAQDAVTWGEQ